MNRAFDRVDALVGGLGFGTAELEVMLCRRCPGLTPSRLFGDERETGICRACSEGAVELRGSRRSVIPTWYRWAKLDAPLVPEGWCEPCVPEAARALASSWARGDGKLLTIGGKSGAGKTVLLAAVANAWIDQGKEVLWVHASDLQGDRPDKAQVEEVERKISRAAYVCIDGIGKELALAGVDSGWIAGRVGPMQRVFETINSRKLVPNARFAIAVELSTRDIERFYGVDVSRRIADDRNATVIALPVPSYDNIKELIP